VPFSALRDRAGKEEAMQGIARGWEADVHRGPDWLIVKLRCPQWSFPETESLADRIWALLQRHFVYRLVLELDELELLTTPLLGQLVVLDRRIRERSGLLRLCGLSPQNREVLRVHGLLGRLPAYGCPRDAVMGMTSRKPR